MTDQPETPEDAALIERLRKTPLYEGSGEESALPEEAADRIAALKAENERLREEAVKMKRRLGGGCDADPEGGAHNVMTSGGYAFCTRCGETVRGARQNRTLRKKADSTAPTPS